MGARDGGCGVDRARVCGAENGPGKDMDDLAVPTGGHVGRVAVRLEDVGWRGGHLQLVVVRFGHLLQEHLLVPRHAPPVVEPRVSDEACATCIVLVLSDTRV